eukprot:PhM_4_TR5257/c0_g1_i1/m.41768
MGALCSSKQCWRPHQCTRACSSLVPRPTCRSPASSPYIGYSLSSHASPTTTSFRKQKKRTSIHMGFGQNLFSCVVDDVKRVLERLIAIVAVEGDISNPVLMKDNQTLLFSQSVHLLVFRMLQAPLRSIPLTQLELQLSQQHREARAVLEVLELGLRLIRYMVRGANDLAFKLMSFIPFVETLLPCRVQAVDTLVQLYHNNSALQLRLTDATIQRYLYPKAFHEVLSACCVCNDVGVTRNQNLIAHQVLANDRRLHVLYPTVLHDGYVLLQHDHTPRPSNAYHPPCLSMQAPTFHPEHDGDRAIRRWRSILKAVENDDDDAIDNSFDDDEEDGEGTSSWVTLEEFIEDGDAECIRYFENGLHLLAALCRGGNQDAREIVSKKISEDRVLAALRVEHRRSLGDYVRAAFLELAMDFVVGDVPFDPLADMPPALREVAGDVRRYQHELSDLLAARPISPREVFVGKLKEIIATILSDNEKQSDSKAPRNALIARCVVVVQKLVSLKFYTKSELLTLVPVLLRLLNPDTDVYETTSLRRVLSHSKEAMAPTMMDTHIDHHHGMLGRTTRLQTEAALAASPRSGLNTVPVSSSQPVKSLGVLQTKQNLVVLLEQLACRYFSFSSYKADVFNTKEMHEVTVLTMRGGVDLLLTGQEAYIHILRQTTMYPGSYELYAYSVRLLVRALGTVMYPTLSENERAIDAVAKMVRNDLTSGQRDFAVNLFRQFSEQKDDDLSVVLLKVFTRVLLGSPDEDSRAWMQGHLNYLGLTPLVCQLCESFVDNVARHALECGIALLDGGNRDVQRSLMSYFMSRSDEALFMAFSKRFRLATRQVVEVEAHHREAQLSETFGTAKSKSMLSATVRNVNQPFVLDGGAVLPVSIESNNLYNIREVMRFLQLFCEGHNTELQDYLREQPDNVHSYNLVKETMTFLRHSLTVEVPSTFMLEVMLQAFNTLTEYCQGPVPRNQLTLVQSNLGQQVSHVFERDFRTTDGDPRVTHKVRSAAITTLLSLLEGCTDKRIPSLLFGNLKAEFFQQHLVAIARGTCLRMTEENEPALELGFNIYILGKTLESYCKDEMGPFFTTHANTSSSGSSGTSSTSVLDVETLDFFRRYTGRIEILRESLIERVYFRIPAVCQNLSKASKEHITWNVNRDTPTMRITDFFKRAEEVIFEIEYVEWYGQQPRVRRLLSADIMDAHRVGCTVKYVMLTYSEIWQRGFHYSTLLANFFLITGCTSDAGTSNDETGIDGVYLYSGYGALLTFISLLMTLFSLAQAFVVAFAIAPISEFRLARRSQNQKGRASGRDDASAAPEETSESLMKRYIVAKSAWDHVRFALKNVTEFHFVLLLCFSCFMSSAASPFFLPFPLLSIVAKNDILLNVIRAVTQNGKSLLLTVALGMVLSYFFAIVGFGLFQEQFINAADQQQCDTLYHCFMFILAHGTRQGGGVGEVMSPLHWGHPLHGWRLVYDMSFFVLVVVILMNIVFGIIIDTFAELRSRKQRIEEDIRTRCFICGLDSTVFDRSGNSFAHHIRYDHNMWYYIYFMHHLQKKDPSEFTGQESYVHDRIAVRDLRFFPLSRALCLDGRTDTDDEDTTHQLAKLAARVDTLDARIQRVLDVVGTESGDVRAAVTEAVATLQRDVRDVADVITAQKRGAGGSSSTNGQNNSPMTGAAAASIR